MRVATIDESLHSKSLSGSRRSEHGLDCSASSLNRSVRFNEIEIREYNVIVGDNPSVHFGPPISIGWDYDKENLVRIPVEDYESVRGERRVAKQLVIPGMIRVEKLHENGVSRSDIVKAVRQVSRAKHKRNQTVNNIKISRLEEAAQSAFRKLKRFIFRRKRESKEWALWMEEFEKFYGKLAVDFPTSISYEVYPSLDNEKTEKTIPPNDEKINSLQENSFSCLRSIVIQEEGSILEETNAQNMVTLHQTSPDSGAGSLLHGDPNQIAAKNSNAYLLENTSRQDEVHKCEKKPSTEIRTLSATMVQQHQNQSTSSKIFTTRAA